MDGGAAQKINQIYAGDIISRINGISVFGWALDKVLEVQSVHFFCRVSYTTESSRTRHLNLPEHATGQGKDARAGK